MAATYAILHPGVYPTCSLQAESLEAAAGRGGRACAVLLLLLLTL